MPHQQRLSNHRRCPSSRGLKGGNVTHGAARNGGSKTDFSRFTLYFEQTRFARSSRNFTFGKPTKPIRYSRKSLRFFGKIGDNYDWRWAHDNDWVKQINDLRRETVELSSNEILNLILEELDLRRIIAAWGNTTQRLENIDVIRKFSLQYENACNRLNAAASLGGFLLWLAQLGEREKDTQSSGTGNDAVNVLTYHKSKGLEYPIVVMGNLEQSLRDDVFGIALDTL
ncbi:MAG: hypothetical protein HC817_15790, partial [Saprospiraceae bacterium]|nr:hypothetical protein [Saprospiraceae bacterium]